MFPAAFAGSRPLTPAHRSVGVGEKKRALLEDGAPRFARKKAKFAGEEASSEYDGIHREGDPIIGGSPQYTVSFQHTPSGNEQVAPTTVLLSVTMSG